MKKIKIILAFFLIAVAFMACKKNEELGVSVIYTPQHDVFNVPIKGTYTVLGTDTTFDALSDSAFVLGAYRSGTAHLEAVTVKFKVDNDTLTKLLLANPTYVALPPAYYTSDLTVSILDGHRDAYTFLNMKRLLILKDKTPITQVFILPVRIASVTKYAINPKLAFSLIKITRTRIKKN